MMSAGRRRLWWRHIKAKEELGLQESKANEEEDGRFESEGSEGRVPSEGHVERVDWAEV
jgi:alkylated DNA nucleotide flippase Atl1